MILFVLLSWSPACCLSARRIHTWVDLELVYTSDFLPLVKHRLPGKPRRSARSVGRPNGFHLLG